MESGQNSSTLRRRATHHTQTGVGSTGTSTAPSTSNTPEQYAAAIAKFSERRQNSFLHPGSHYRQLAQFLEPNLHSRPVHVGGLNSSPSIHVVVHELLSKGDRKREAFDDRTGLPGLERLAPPEPGCGRVMFICGYSRRDWILRIGAQYKIDPEYLRRHIEFSASSNSYDLPTVLSGSRNIIQLRLTTVYSHQLPFTEQQFQRARRTEATLIQGHQQRLGSTGNVGEAVARKLSIHNESCFSIEQDISICVKRKQNGTWIAFVWIDSGHDLAESVLGHELYNHARPFPIPIVVHRPKGALVSLDEEQDLLARSTGSIDGLSHQQLKSSATHQFGLLPFHYGSTLDLKAAATCPIYALSEFFTFAAASECQFLNMIQDQISRNVNIHTKLEVAVSNLRHTKTLLNQHIQRLKHMIALLKEPELCEWSQPTTQLTSIPAGSSPSVPNSASNSSNNIHGVPSPSVSSPLAGSPGVASLPTDNGTTTTAAGASSLDKTTWKTLRTDFEEILARAQDLAAQCLEGMDMITNSAMLAESQKSIQQAERITRLTLLAFFFLPLSFTTSLFGMNFRQMDQEKMEIWWFFVVLGPVMFLSGLICFWDRVVGYYRRLTMKPSGGIPGGGGGIGEGIEMAALGLR